MHHLVTQGSQAPSVPLWAPGGAGSVPQASLLERRGELGSWAPGAGGSPLHLRYTLCGSQRLLGWSKCPQTGMGLLQPKPARDWVAEGRTLRP